MVRIRLFQRVLEMNKMKEIKSVLCYGDSNTYGYSPVTGMRFSEQIRWTGCLQMLLGNQYRIIEEGCNGRTTIFNDPNDPWKNGLSYLKPCLNSHKPIDIVIVMLGTNDLKTIFHADMPAIASGIEEIIQEIQTFTKQKQGFVPQIILVAPPKIGKGICESPFAASFDASAITRSHEFAKYYQDVAKRNNCVFFDAAQFAQSSDEDSLHLMPSEHEKLANALADCIKQMQ